MEAAVQKLIEYALQKKLITAYDVYVVRNQLMEALHLTEWKDCTVSYDGELMPFWSRWYSMPVMLESLQTLPILGICLTPSSWVL